MYICIRICVSECTNFFPQTRYVYSKNGHIIVQSITSRNYTFSDFLDHISISMYYPDFPLNTLECIIHITYYICTTYNIPVSIWAIFLKRSVWGTIITKSCIAQRRFASFLKGWIDTSWSHRHLLILLLISLGPNIIPQSPWLFFTWGCSSCCGGFWKKKKQAINHLEKAP